MNLQLPFLQYRHAPSYAFDTQSQLTEGFYITSDFSNIFYSFSNHFQRRVYDYTWKQAKLQKNRIVDFKYIYTQCKVMISHPFRIGFVQVNSVIVEYTLHIAFAKVFEHPS